jgi:hypothetical protein
MSFQDQISILLYGQNRRLLQTRQMVLQRSGYRVWVATDQKEIDALSRTETVSLLVLCHSLTLLEWAHFSLLPIALASDEKLDTDFTGIVV